MNFLGASWQPKVIALLTALFGFIAFSPETFQQWPWLIQLAKYVAIGGFVGLGFTTKGASVTGGTVAQDDKLVGNPAATSSDPTKLVKKD